MFDLMKILKTEYTVNFVNVLKQTWQENDVWSCINKPKEYHLFLLIENGKVDYTLKNGRKLTAKSGDLVYIPAGAEYITSFSLDSNNLISSIGVNFKLFSETSEYLRDSEIFVFNSTKTKKVIYEIERLSYSFNEIKNKFNTEIYNAFNILCDEFYKLEFFSDEFALIKNGVEYLHQNYDKNFELPLLAEICNVSEVYFRKLFKKLLGYTPTDYRIKLRLDKAIEYLKFTTIPINLIAENLGFTDSAYFTKVFKEKYKVTPLNYRKK